MVMGAIARAVITDPAADTAPPAIHYDSLPKVEVIGYSSEPLVFYAGGVSARIKVEPVDSGLLQRTARLISDTIELMIKPALAIYPNPVARGAVVSLSLRQGLPGIYRLGLYDARGALIQQRSFELESKGQVELLNIPASLPGGTYFMNVSAPDLKKCYTQKLVIL
jgi:hypothetical protein